MAYSLFEITKEDIKELDDTQLEELIRRLCEADVVSAGESTKCVSYGGKSGEPDGGLDIVVTMRNDPPQSIFISRKTTGIQVKKTNMTPSKIESEMSVHIGSGKLINCLAEQSGAYIIVSSGSSCTPQKLKERKEKMVSLVSDVPGRENLDLDYFDLEKITQWVNTYPGIVAWVKLAIGKPQNDWYPYSNWSNPGTPGGYILDGKLRLFEYPRRTDQKETVEAGIRSIRAKLSLPGSSVRLIGLSGVGKTRLVQALFEPDVGEQSLPQDWALYTENNHPIPLPEEMAQSLTNKRIVLIIDNCSRNVHKKLTRSIKNSQISLLTIDYDIQDDSPQETDVFVLEPASKNMLVKLLKRTNPDVDTNIVDRIASLSDGNSRIALALVQAFRKSEDFGTLLDEEIFERLFWQNNGNNEVIYETAKACSLVYSFDTSDPESDESEIQLLAKLADQTYEKFHSNLEAIRKKGLLQSRGQWSALLPQALANRIASNALPSYTDSKILEVFVGSRADRLQSSFCHRLSFLHSNQSAKRISIQLLSPQGELGQKGMQLNAADRKKIYYLLSVDFSNSLNYLDRLVNLIKENPIKEVSTENATWIVHSLFVLAYFPENFEKALSLIENLLLIKIFPKKIELEVSKQINRLFWPLVSGTMTPPAQKHEHISGLLQSIDPELNNLGVQFLNAAFQTENFFVSGPTEFGARPLTLGYKFKSEDEIKEWYKSLINILSTTFRNQPILKTELLSIIEKNFRRLWKLGYVSDELSNFVKLVRNEQSWVEIWAEIEIILKSEYTKKNKDLWEKLEDLETLTRPDSVAEEVRIYLRRPDAFIFSTSASAGDASRALQGIVYEEKMKEFGEKISKELDVLDEIGPDLFVNEYYGVIKLVESITRNSQDILLLWQKLLNNYRRANNGGSQRTFISFFKTLWEVNPNLADSLVNEVSKNPDLSEIFPSILILKPNIDSDISRLRKSLKSRKSSPYSLREIAKLQIGDQISEIKFCELLDILLETREGYNIAISSLGEKFREYQNKSKQIPPLLLEKGRDFLFKANSPGLIDWRDPLVDVYLSTILASTPGSYLPNDRIVKFLQELFPEDLEKAFSGNYHPEINKELAKRYPIEFLDSIFERIGQIDPRKNNFLINNLDSVGVIIQNVSLDTIITWMKTNLVTRAQFLSRYVQLVDEDRQNGMMRWTEFGYKFLSQTFDIPTVLDNIMLRMLPRSWFGNYSLTLKKYLPLFDDPIISDKPDLQFWRNQAKAQLLKQIEWEEREEARDQNSELSYE